MSRSAVFLLCALAAQAAVTRVEVMERADLPVTGYERVGGKLHFALDPKLAANKSITDLALAPRNAKGLVEFTADFLVFHPKDPSKGNGAAIFEPVNRGRTQIWSAINTSANSAMRSQQDMGDAFLLKEGYTLVWVGWQFDAPAREGNLRVYAPEVPNVTGPVRLEILPNAKQQSESLPYPLADANSGTLTVRDAPYGPRMAIGKTQWRYSEDHQKVQFPQSLDPGRIYEFVYTAKEPVVAGVGFAAVRDYISYIRKNGISRQGEIKNAIAMGISQSGRMVRTFLSEGFNADEEGKPVFDGAWAHVAGAGHGGFTDRFVQPGRTTGQYSGSFYPTDQTPFAPGPLLAEAGSANANLKLFLTNGSQEYWGRAAALNHVTEDGSRDLDPPANVRIYYVAGTQHGGGGGGANANVQNVTNSMDWTYFMRATLTSLHAWVARNVTPPGSVFPRLDKGQLVPMSALRFPQIPNFALVNYVYQPRRLDFGPEYLTKGIVAYEPAHAGGSYPALVPQVDGDGNETSGIRLPELVWPIATHTGWNLRNPKVGSPDQQYALIGSQAAFARTKADREKTGDTRPSIGERYKSKADYQAKVEAAARRLVGQRFLLEDDVERVVASAGRHWDAIVNPSAK